MTQALTELKQPDLFITLFEKKVRNYQLFELVGARMRHSFGFGFVGLIRLFNP